MTTTIKLKLEINKQNNTNSLLQMAGVALIALQCKVLFPPPAKENHEIVFRIQDYFITVVNISLITELNEVYNKVDNKKVEQKEKD